MSNGKLTVAQEREERERRYQNNKKAEAARKKQREAEHPGWSDFTRNQKRNMRRRLKKR